MSSSGSWDGTTYSIPTSGEVNWPSLSNFLIALRANAAVAKQMKQAIRVCTSTPVTVAAATDFAIIVDLTVPGASAVNLPAGVNGQIFPIIDGKGDAGTNNITVTPNGAQTIAGAANLVMSRDRQCLFLQYHAATTDWKILANIAVPGEINAADIADGSVSNTEFQYINSLTSNAQDQLDALDAAITADETALADHIADGTDAHDASAISSVAAGNLAATNVQTALDELQADIDTRALDSDLDALTTVVAGKAADADLTAHIADTSTHGVTGDIVGTTDTQTLENKTLTAPAVSAGSHIDMLVRAAVRFNDDSGGEYVAVRAPTGVTTHTLNLPAAQGGASTVLSNDGSGNLSWAAGASATLNQNNTDIGNSSNTRTATDTNLLGDVKGSTGSSTVTMTIASPCVVTYTSHPLATGDKVYLTTTGALPTGLSASTTYYVYKIDANTFRLSSTLANAAIGTGINTSGSQSGTHTLFFGGMVLTSGVKCTVTNDNATAGYLGEQITATGSSNSMASNDTTNANLTSITLTPGNWRIDANFSFTNGSGSPTASIIDGGISTSTAFSGIASGGLSGMTYSSEIMPIGTATIAVVVPPRFVKITSSTTYYIVARWIGSLGGGTVNGTGTITGTRIR